MSSIETARETMRIEGDRLVESMRYVRSYPDEFPNLAHRLPEVSIVADWVAGGCRNTQEKADR